MIWELIDPKHWPKLAGKTDEEIAKLIQEHYEKNPYKPLFEDDSVTTKENCLRRYVNGEIDEEELQAFNGGANDMLKYKAKKANEKARETLKKKG